MKLIQGPNDEPLSVDEVLENLRIDHNIENGLLSALIVAAREYAEKYTGLRLISQVWEFDFSVFELQLIPKYGPLIEVQKIEYLDPEGQPQTMPETQYRFVSVQSSVGCIVPTVGNVWPQIMEGPGAVTVTAEVGFGDAEDIPQTIKQAMHLHIAHFYENRSDGDLPSAVEHLLHPYKTYA